MRRFSFIIIIAGIALFSGCRQNEQAEDNSRFAGANFREHIRSTDARTPEDEQAGFKLPEGFEIQLFASEPDIGKPMNLNFDAQGRLWVTQSFEYPFPASPGKGKDRITILEDTDHDGRADRFLHFSDTLNIPIGLFPLDDGGAVAYSIPNVYRFFDNDGDGKADAAQKLFGPFQHRDTHGMVNNFIRGYDGWIHACHGFTNHSTIAGTDGDSITMISGNTFRFRPDGSRVEHMTDGRINPFGLAYDELGYLYSTDCHTSPLYQLIRGGDYTQWGKEEKMGFAPDMKPLEKEATALAGIAYYADNLFPEKYRSNFYIGDVVASRVYRNSYTFKGSSPVGKLEEDFVLSEDPWFRPVNVKLGPDGALYIADFYNSIIGHYEVPLDHPKRDRIRGRIWRITYKGREHKFHDLTKADVSELIKLLDDDNLTLRLSVADQLVNRIGQAAVAPVTALVNDEDASSRAYIHALWVLHRLDALPVALIKRAAEDDDPLVRVHTMRILAERDLDENTYWPLVSERLKDNDPHVRRAATELLVKFPTMASVKQALYERGRVPEYDTHQLYTTRLVLRNLLRNEDLMREVLAEQWKPEDTRHILDVLVDVPSREAAIFLARNIDQSDWQGERLARQYTHLARYIPAPQLSSTIGEVMESRNDDVDSQYLVFKGIQQGIARRGEKESADVQRWGSALAKALLEKYDAGTKREKAVVARQKFAADLAGKYRIRSLEPALMSLVAEGSKADEDVKLAALRSLLTLDPGKHAALAGRILQNGGSSKFRNSVAAMLGDFHHPAVNKVLAGVTNAPPDLQSTIVMALASSSEGKDMIFQKVKNGEFLPRTLIEPKVEERIMLNISPKQKKQFETLTANLEPVSKERQALIETRVIAFNALTKPVSPDSGRMVFKKNCSICHSIGNEGGAIGPQLDGVGKWGPRALAEKILDPNRNISAAFRNYTIKLKDGKVMSGLFRRDEGEVTVFADITGKEFSVAKADIAEQKASPYTLMPDTFSSVLSEDDFNALLKYLLSLQQG